MFSLCVFMNKRVKTKLSSLQLVICLESKAPNLINK